MNRVQSERFRDIHLDHEYNLIHMLPSTEIPALSGFYLKSFYNGSKRYRLRLPESIIEPDGKFCGNCGALRIPLFNTDMSMMESDDADSGKSIKTLQYTCLHCKNQAQLAPTRVPKQEEVSADRNLNSGPQAQQQKQDKVNKKASSAKERAKKRKKSTLSNMLTQKNEEKKSKSFSLSLENMMQNN